MINLSRLEEIKDLRTVWPHEALDFTPWLAQDDNIGLLADAVGLDITVDETESSVGDFNVDIFASETGTDQKIIIENQLEDTNHDPLGKLITYASGKAAMDGSVEIPTGTQASVFAGLPEKEIIAKAGALFTADMKQSGIPASVSLFARHGRALTGVSPEHAQIVGNV